MSRGALGYGLPEYLSQTPLVVHPISRLSFLAKRTRSPRGKIMIGLSQPGYPVPHFPAFLAARVAMWPCPGQWDVSRRYLGALLIWKKEKKRQMSLSPSRLSLSCLKCERGAWSISSHLVTTEGQITNLWMAARKRWKEPRLWYCSRDAASAQSAGLWISYLVENKNKSHRLRCF